MRTEKKFQIGESYTATTSPRGNHHTYKVISRTPKSVTVEGIFIDGSSKVEQRRKMVATTYLSAFGINKEFFYVYGQGIDAVVCSPENNSNNPKLVSKDEIFSHDLSNDEVLRRAAFEAKNGTQKWENVQTR